MMLMADDGDRVVNVIDRRLHWLRRVVGRQDSLDGNKRQFRDASGQIGNASINKLGCLPVVLGSYLRTFSSFTGPDLTRCARG
jgi:hypothetical protein